MAEIDWLPGAATLYRRDRFLELGGFDPLYFMYCEDSELSTRARAAGSLLLRAPEAVLLHDHSHWGRREQFRGLRRWTISATTLSYQQASSRRRGLAQLARRRSRWFAIMARERRWTQLAAGLAGTASWPAKIPQIERRKRRRWDGHALQAWLELASTRVTTRRL